MDSNIYIHMYIGFPDGSTGKESACNAGSRPGFDPWFGKMEEGMATHSSILAWRISIDRGVWQATVQGATKGQT